MHLPKAFKLGPRLYKAPVFHLLPAQASCASARAGVPISVPIPAWRLVRSSRVHMEPSSWPQVEASEQMPILA